MQMPSNTASSHAYCTDTHSHSEDKANKGLVNYAPSQCRMLHWDQTLSSLILCLSNLPLPQTFLTICRHNLNWLPTPTCFFPLLFSLLLAVMNFCHLSHSPLFLFLSSLSLLTFSQQCFSSSSFRAREGCVRCCPLTPPPSLQLQLCVCVCIWNSVCARVLAI